MGIEGLERLEAWRKAKEFALRIYREVLPRLPIEEKWNLVAQLRRSSASVPANLAEGHGRFYYQESIRFSYIARGSLEETYSHLVMAHELQYLSDPLFAMLREESDEVSRLINGYIAYLKQSRQGANEPGNDKTLREVGDAYIDNELSTPDLP